MNGSNSIQFNSNIYFKSRRISIAMHERTKKKATKRKLVANVIIIFNIITM